MVTEKMVEYFAGDVRRINHALKVDAFASMLSKSARVDNETFEAIHYAAILHDIGIKVSEKNTTHRQEIIRSWKARRSPAKYSPE
jgi:uncharacterized protein